MQDNAVFIKYQVRCQVKGCCRVKAGYAGRDRKCIKSCPRLPALSTQHLHIIPILPSCPTYNLLHVEEDRLS